MRFRSRLHLYAKDWVNNEIGEREKGYVYQKTVFCSIVPNSGGISNIADTEVKDSFTTLTINIRKLSIKNPEIDMYFRDDDGIKYEILDFFPFYKDNSEWQFKCKIVREV